jgi:hypothetical protein
MYRRQERCIQGFVGRPEGKRPLGRPRPNGRITLKWILKKRVSGGMDWIDMA